MKNKNVFILMICHQDKNHRVVNIDGNQSIDQTE